VRPVRRCALRPILNGAGRSLGAANPATSILINAFGGAAAIALRADDARGLLRQSERQYPPAIDDFTAAHGLMPQQVDRLLARALSYRAVGQANLDEAVQDDPQNAQLWVNGGSPMSASGIRTRRRPHTPAPLICARRMKLREPALPASAATEIRNVDNGTKPKRPSRSCAFKSCALTEAFGGPYFGSTEWNTDFAADSISSATEERPCGGGGEESTASARKSIGVLGKGISAGGVGRCVSPVRGAGGDGGFISAGGVETMIGGGSGCSGTGGACT
jgi:hypothetical protein